MTEQSSIEERRSPNAKAHTLRNGAGTTLVGNTGQTQAFGREIARSVRCGTSAEWLECAGCRQNLPAGKTQGKLGSRLSALGSRLSALGSRLSALGSRLSALGSRLSALGSRLHTQVLKLTRSRCAAHQRQFRGFFLGDDLAVAGRKQCPVPCQRARAKRPARIGRRYRCAIQRGARPPSRHFLQRSLLSTIDRTKPGCFPLRVLGLGPSEPSAGKCSTARLCHRSPSNVTPFETRALSGIPCR